MLKAKPIVLIVLDGFGVAPQDKANAITLAYTPFLRSLYEEYPCMLLEASGLNVGLPRDEVGNSEVGHLAIGSGILKYQSLPRIDRSIATKEFTNLPSMVALKDRLLKTKGKLHIMGLIGNGGVHASQEHLRAIIDWTKKEKIWKRTFLHAFLDGRDTARNTGAIFLKDTLDYMGDKGHLATIGGRFYGMDRNTNWDRIQKAYDAMVFGKSANTTDDPLSAVQASYAGGVFDEEFVPMVVTDGSDPVATIDDGDSILFFNFRADRARQLTEALSSKTFSEFERKNFSDVHIVTFTEYKKSLPVNVLYPPELIHRPIGKIFSDNGLRQLHIAETEKYAHVTFFLNGLQEKPFPGEDRILIPSPAVSSYDQQPEMSCSTVSEKVLEAIESGTHDVIIINYANPDMVGHTGNLQACVRAIEATDRCLSSVVTAATRKGGMVFIVGDHGNAEMLINPMTGELDKEHNFSPVPFIIVSNEFKGRANTSIIDGDPSMLQPVGILADVAPTLLELSGLPVPSEMTGTRLF